MTVRARVRTGFLTIREWANRPRLRRWLLMFAAAIFAAMAIGSFRSLPDDRGPMQPAYMVVAALVATPATLLLNALEYRSIAKAAGHHVGLGDAARVSLAASLANLLPVPGAVAVRTAALKRAGSSIGSALSANAIAGGIWLGATAVLVGLALLGGPGRTAVGALVGLAGMAGLAASAYVLRRQTGTWQRLFVELLLVETGAALVSALRVWLSFAAIGQTESLAAVVTISSAHILAAAIGILPGGLGLREAIGAGLASAVQVPAAVAVAASAVDRFSVQAGMALCAPALGLRLGLLSRRGKRGTAATGPEDSTTSDTGEEEPASSHRPQGKPNRNSRSSIGGEADKDATTTQPPVPVQSQDGTEG